VIEQVAASKAFSVATIMSPACICDPDDLLTDRAVLDVLVLDPSLTSVIATIHVGVAVGVFVAVVAVGVAVGVGPVGVAVGVAVRVAPVEGSIAGT